MTDRAKLVEKVARAIDKSLNYERLPRNGLFYWLEADAAIDIVLEEAARVADELRHPDYSSETEDWVAGTEAVAAAIRAMKGEATSPESAAPDARQSRATR